MRSVILILFQKLMGRAFLVMTVVETFSESYIFISLSLLNITVLTNFSWQHCPHFFCLQDVQAVWKYTPFTLSFKALSLRKISSLMKI